MQNQELNYIVDRIASLWNSNSEVVKNLLAVAGGNDATFNRYNSFFTVLHRTEKRQINQININAHTQFSKLQCKENIVETRLLREIIDNKVEIERRNSFTVDVHNQIEKIKQFPMIKSLYYEGNGIVIRTQDVIIKKDNVEYNLGKYQMSFTDDRKLPFIKNTTHNMWEYPHHCISRSGTICLGTYKNPLAKYIQARRFDYFVETLLHFLLSGDDRDAHKPVKALFDDDNTIRNDEEEEEESIPLCYCEDQNNHTC